MHGCGRTVTAVIFALGSESLQLRGGGCIAEKGPVNEHHYDMSPGYPMRKSVDEDSEGAFRINGKGQRY